MAPPTDLNSAIDQIDALERENKILREENLILRKGKFGRSTERIEPGQLTMTMADWLGDTAAPAEATTIEVPSHKRRKKKDGGHGRRPFPDHLPRNVFDLDGDVVPTCSCCDKPMKAIGEEATERGHIIPAAMVVNRYVRKKWACSDGHEIQTAPAPEGLIARARFEPSVYAHVAVAKYHDHVPLHRLSGILGRYGIPVAKQTMWDMLVTVDELVAQPILRQMRHELLQCSALHADETEITMRLEGGKGSKKAYLWCWRSLEGEQPSRALMDFRTTRNRHGPIEFLGDWTGTLIIDGYSGYNEVARINGIVRAGCWAHVRRKWKDALEGGSKSAASVLVWIQRLFWLERAMNARIERLNLDPLGALGLRHQHRGRCGRRIIEKAYDAADRIGGMRGTLPKSKLGKAVKYQLRQRMTLEVFLVDPRIPIHNNAAERDIRHVAIGRKNWWVVASQRGGEVAARMYSLMLSCKQAGVNPESYLASVLELISTTKDRDIAQLTPWGWGAMQAARTVEDVDVLETRPS